MLSTQEKLLEINQSIQRELNQQIEQIDKDVEHYRQTQMQQIEDEILADCYQMIQRSITAISLKYTTERSHMLGEQKKKLLLQRDEYASLIFEEVRQRLSEFTGGPEYEEYLRRKFKAAVREYRLKKPVIRVRKSDLSFETLFSEELPGCKVRVSPDITLGGFVIEDAGKSYMINESLDNVLEEQKEWFFSNSGLRITQNETGKGVDL